MKQAKKPFHLSTFPKKKLVARFLLKDHGKRGARPFEEMPQALAQIFVLFSFKSVQYLFQ